MKAWEHIIIHHSLTKDSETVSWQAIRRYHVNDLHWADIGYHFGIELVGGDYEILMGRTLDQTGAHTRRKNGTGIGICFVGNYDLAPPPHEILERAVPLIRWLRHTHNIPVKNIVAHHDFADYKTCPGKMFDMGKLRFMVGDL